MQEVLYEAQGPVAIITLNRPAALNSFTTLMRAELAEALRAADASPSIRAVVLTGAGRCFSAGADLKGIPGVGAEIVLQLEYEYGASLRRIAEMSKPVIAALSGFAAGIGASYVLCSDLVVMGSSAYMLVPFAKIGLVPDGGMSGLLGQRLGHRRAFEVAVSGDKIDAARCLEWGLVNRVVPDAEVLETACAWAAQLALCAPLAIGYTKRAIRESPLQTYGQNISREAQWQGECIDSADFREGVAAFLEKRAPQFTGK